MNCLRCGRETQDEHVFCDKCLESMEKYPVRPGTAVILPKHKDTAGSKKARRHPAPSPQDQIKKLKRQRRSLRISVICMTLIISGLIGALVYSHFHQEEKPGQNYVVVETKENDS